MTATPTDEQVLAVRGSVALSRGDHVACVHVPGPDGFAAVDRVIPRELFLRDGQTLHTLVLDEAARPRADLYVMNVEDDLYLLSEGLSGSELAALIGGGARDLSPEHTILSAHGPYAWELLAEALTPDVIGIPYLGVFRHEDVLGLRAGKTGEYGYDLIVPRSGAAAVWERLQEVAQAFDGLVVGLEALDACALENAFFSARWGLPDDVTPIELQLQWRVSYLKEGFIGADALRARRRDGARRRLTTVIAPAPLAAGDEVVLGGAPVGVIVAAAHSPVLDGFVAAALLDRAYAWPGLSAFTVGGARVHSVSPPVLDNRSLFVDPQRHTYSARDTVSFPAVARPVPWDGSTQRPSS